ncbi:MULTISPECIES: hypothetical protein [Thiorhodovibrio]|uniref:hypothetical protein n=1 Tax=Thiorhodovibrio TaxID=61593 RepID=UPI0019139C26|nr:MULTISPECIES: hypothetical protein [Thiorhodovibrio]WPL12384.1 hypothetical protein Thiosp_02148 [Thiorhodovibrio litoralis]
MLLARLFKSLPLTRQNYGTDMRIIACITDAAPVEKILGQIGEPGRLLRSVIRGSEKPKIDACALNHSMSGLSKLPPMAAEGATVCSWPLCEASHSGQKPTHG